MTVFIPPAVEPGEPPTNMSRIKTIEEDVKPGDTLMIVSNLQNYFEFDLTKVKVTAVIYNMGEKGRVGPFSIEGEEEETRILLIEIPYDAKPGEYDIRITVSNDQIRRVMHRSITVIE